MRGRQYIRWTELTKSRQPKERRASRSAWPRGRPNVNLTLTLTLGVNPHRTLETLADKILTPVGLGGRAKKNSDNSDNSDISDNNDNSNNSDNSDNWMKINKNMAELDEKTLREIIID